MTCRRVVTFQEDATILQAMGLVFTGTPVSSTTQKHQTISGMGGTKSYEMNATADDIVIPTAGATAGEEICVAIYSSANAVWGIPFRIAGTANCSITLAADGFIRLYRGTFSVLLATSAGTITPDAWTYFRFKITAREAASGGRMQVFINGSTTAFADTGAGVDCRNTSTDDFDSIALSCDAGVLMYVSAYSQWASGTAPTRVQYPALLRPTAESGTPDGVPSTGTDNSATIDEDPVSLLDYNELSTAGHEDHLVHSDIPGGTPLVVTVVQVMAHMTGEGTITQARTLFESSGSTTYGTNQPLQTGGTYGVIRDVYEVDPNGGGALTGAVVNAGIFGYEVN